MKAPRVTDFDPNAPEAPEVETATKALGSPLDGMPAIVRPSPSSSTKTNTENTDRSTSVPPVRDVPPPPGSSLSPSPSPSTSPLLPAGASGQSAYMRANTAQTHSRGAGIGAAAGVGAGARVALRRAIKQRHPFDIYADQLDSLRQLAYEERIQGGVGSMSAMVRDALDAYIAAKTTASVGGRGGSRSGSGSAAEEHGERPQSTALADSASASRAEGTPEDAV